MACVTSLAGEEVCLRARERHVFGETHGDSATLKHGLRPHWNDH